MSIPQAFLDSLRPLLGDQTDSFAEAMSRNPETSIKVNRRKLSGPEILGYEPLTPVKWCRNGYYLSSRPVFTLNPLLHAGAFYVQDASSMIYESVIEKILPAALDTGNPPVLLDMCAAPGGKTTSIINALPDGAFVVANEFSPQRASILKENLIKWGYPDFVITNSPTKAFRKTPEMFDIIAVDAPCSGEGMMRKETVAVTQWGEGLIRQCASLQREILSDAFEALKPGGFLIYSTCTFNRHEDEENVEWLVNEYGMVPFDLEFPDEWGIGRGIDTAYPCLRFMPHITRGEGLFVAVLRKEGEYRKAPVRAKNIAKALEGKTRIICDGIPRTMTKGRDTVPAPESALAVDFDLGGCPSVELDEATALSYLRHESLRLSAGTPKGFVAVTFGGLPLGFVNNLGNRANNLYPKEWRIRNL